MNENYIDALEPYGLEASIKTLPDPHLNDGLKNVGVPSIQSQKVEAYKPLEKGELDNIFKATKSVKTGGPFEDKTQDASLSERYKGRNVFYGDYKLDPKLLDARYSKTQSWSEQSLNSLKIGAANGGAMFAASLLSIPDLIYSIASGDDITNTKLNQELFKWTRGVAENNVTFENEQDQQTDAWNTIKNILMPSFVSGSSKGWGGTFENVMFGVGAGLGAYVTAGLGTTAGIAKLPSLATNIAKSLNNVNNIRKYGSFVDKIIDSSAALKNATTALNNTYKLNDIAKWGYRSSIGAYGEAAFEAQEARFSLKNDLTKKYIDANGHEPTGDDLAKIDNIVNEGGKARFWANMALLMGSNTIQNRRLFRNFDAARESAEQLAKQGLNVSLDATGKAVAKKNFELTSDWWTKGFGSKIKKPIEAIGNSGAGDFILESTSEGIEEFSQGWIDKAVNNYSMWKLDHRGQPSIDQAFKSIQEGFVDSWNNEGLKSFVSGMFAGTAQQAVYAGVGKGYTAVKNPEQLKMGEKRQEELQRTLSSYDGFNINDFVGSVNIDSVRNSINGRAENLNAQGVIDDVAEGAVQNSDKKLYKDMESISFFTLSEPYVSRGHGQILKDQFAFSLENMNDQQVQDLFNSKLSASEIKSRFNNQVDAVSDSYNKIKQSFRNPYSYSGNEQERIRYNIFEKEFIPQLAYLDHRLKDLNKRKEDIQSSLGEYYQELKFSANIKDVGKNKAYIKEQIDSFEKSEDYLKFLNSPVLAEEFNKSKYLVDSYKKSLELLEKFEQDQTEENYKNFLDDYYEAALSKIDRKFDGSFDKDEVMQNLSDYNRINEDLNIASEMLKSYFNDKNGELFTSSFAALAKRESRKRDVYSLSEEFKKIKPQLVEQYPDFTEEEIDNILLESRSKEDAIKNLEKKKETKEKRNKEIEDIKTKIREKFINAGKGDLVEDYLKETAITNEKDSLNNAEDYIKKINNDDFKEFKQNLLDELTVVLKGINSDFEGINEDVYNTLQKDGKIEYHKALIDYYKKLLKYKGLPKTFRDQQERLIGQQEDAIQELSKSEVETFHEQIENYTIVKDEDYLVYLDGEIIESFPSLQEARKYVSDSLIKKSIKNDVKADLINNIENKFENGSYNPEIFDKDGGRLSDKENPRTEIMHKIVDGKSEQQISDSISANLIVDKFSLEEREDATQIFDKEDSGQLPQELILRSVTTDAITISYNDDILGPVRLSTYKNYKNGLGFMSNLREILLNPEKYKMKKTFNVPTAISNNIIQNWNSQSIGKTLTKVNSSEEEFYTGEKYEILGEVTNIKFKNNKVSAISYLNKNNELKWINSNNWYGYNIESDSEIDKIVDFIGDSNYYEFLKKSIVDPSVYNTLQSHGFIQFKTSPQEQLNTINEKQKIWDYLNTESLENIQKNIEFKREFYSINYNLNEIGTQEFKNIVHPFANLDGYNISTFFRIKENNNVSDIEFIGLSETFHKTAKEKIEHSFKSKTNGNTTIFSGNYMLLSDSSGNPLTYRLANKNLSPEAFLELFKENSEQVMVMSDNPNISVRYDFGKEQFSVKDKTDGYYLYIKYPIKTLENVNNLLPKLYSSLSKKDKWFEDSKVGNGTKTKALRADNVKLSLVSTAAKLPRTVEEIINTRVVKDISAKNFHVDKIVPSFKTQKEGIKLEPVKKEEVKKEIIADNIISVFEKYKNKLPNTITFEDVVKVSGNNSNLATTIMIGAIERQIIETSPIYLNDVSKINLPLLEKISGGSSKATSGAFKKSNFAKLFTTKIPYKTNINTNEQRVQDLLKNCFR